MRRRRRRAQLTDRQAVLLAVVATLCSMVLVLACGVAVVQHRRDQLPRQQHAVRSVPMPDRPITIPTARAPAPPSHREDPPR